MKKSELIEKLQSIPGNPDVAILDYQKNAAYDDGDGSSVGTYSDIGVELITGEGLPADHPAVVDGMLPWLALYFKNEDYEEDDAGSAPNLVRRCRICGCTDHDYRQCIEKTGGPCYWVEGDLCSACV